MPLLGIQRKRDHSNWRQSPDGLEAPFAPNGLLSYNAPDRFRAGSTRFMDKRFWVLLSLFLLMTAAGLLLGEARFVFANASLICLSCIGIQ